MSKEQNSRSNQPDQMVSIYDVLRKVIIDYKEETGIAITYVNVEWYDIIGGDFSIGKIKIDSQSY